MLCTACGYDNIDGVDDCEDCGQPLVEFDPKGSELEESITRHTVNVLCPKQPITVESTSIVKDVVDQMVERKIGCLLVQDDGELLGVFTERDVLNKVTSDLKTLESPVADLMTPSPVTILRDDSIAYALQCMDLGGYRHMAIVDEAGTAQGIISIRDILRFLCVRFGAIRSQAG